MQACCQIIEIAKSLSRPFQRKSNLAKIYNKYVSNYSRVSSFRNLLIYYFDFHLRVQISNISNVQRMHSIIIMDCTIYLMVRFLVIFWHKSVSPLSTTEVDCIMVDCVLMISESDRSTTRL